jgi:hypothetical protein
MMRARKSEAQSPSDVGLTEMLQNTNANLLHGVEGYVRDFRMISWQPPM